MTTRLTRFLVFLVAAVALIGTTSSRAWAADEYAPPPLRGHVVDQTGSLSEVQLRHLDKKLDRARKQTGFAIVILILPKLPDGLSIEDVGYKTGNAWQVGSKAGDDGILLIAALEGHKLRIETGKGAGGALTDIQASHINREVILPLVKEGKTYEAMDRGTDAIIKALNENQPEGSNPGRDPSAGGKSTRGPPHSPATKPAPTAMTTADYIKFGVIGLLIIGVIALAIISPAFREILFWILLFGRFGGGGGGGGSRDDDDGDGGSGYGGGGGSFGGGGSSDE